MSPSARVLAILGFLTAVAWNGLAFAEPVAVNGAPATTVAPLPAVTATPATPSAAPAAAPTAPGATPAPVDDDSYTLGTADKLRIIVYNEVDLSGEFVVDSSGYVRFPLVGQIKAAGFTVHEFENQVAAKLTEGYLNNPRVNVEVETYRPFYIIGEVNKPGEYPYVSGMTVLSAVALAGGFTYRADEGSVNVRRNGSDKEDKVPANQLSKIKPGDIIRVGERFF